MADEEAGGFSCSTVGSGCDVVDCAREAVGSACGALRLTRSVARSSDCREELLDDSVSSSSSPRSWRTECLCSAGCSPSCCRLAWSSLWRNQHTLIIQERDVL